MRNLRLGWLLSLLVALVLAFSGCGGAGDDDDDSADDGFDDDGGDAGDDDYSGDDDDDDDDDNDFSDDDDDDDYSDDDGSSDDDDDDDDNDTVDDDDDDDESPDEIQCPDDPTPQVLYLSADDSNSQASPVIARAIINQGDIVPRGKVRTYEFTNYYQIEYDPAPAGRINIVPQMRPLEGGDDDGHWRWEFQIGAQSEARSQFAGRHLNLTFSLDTSGSMEGLSFQLLQKTMRVIAGRLKEGDVVSVVEWDNVIATPLDSRVVSGPNDPVLLNVIDALQVDGSTNLHAGLVRAYELAEKNYDPTRMNRVVLISDAQANTGITDIEIIAEAADDSEGEGIYLVGVGVGEPYAYFNDKLMDDVTDAGKGAYVFIDAIAEADKQFGDRFQENMEIAAMNVRVRLELPFYLLMEEYHGEEYSPNPHEVEPQHLAPNDAMVFNQFLVACDNVWFNPADVIAVQAEYIDPTTREEKTDSAAFTIAEMLEANADQLIKGDAIVTYAEALKEIDRILWETGDYDAALDVCVAARQKAAAAAATLGDAELAEIADLLETYEATIAWAGKR